MRTHIIVGAVLAAATWSVANAQDGLPPACRKAFAAEASSERQVKALEACRREPKAPVPTRVQAHLVLGNLALQAGEDASALEHFDLVTQSTDGSEVFIDDEKFYIDRANLRSQRSRLDEALKDLDMAQALATAGDRAGLLRTRTAVLARGGRYEDAVAPARELAALAPEDWTAHVNLAGVLRSLGRFDEALAEADRAVALAPNQYAVHNNRCYVLVTRGDAREALPSCERAVALAPQSWQVADSYAAALEALGRKADAAREYHRAITLAPASERASFEEALARVSR
jgi:Flp pilus assembly protein TadD